MANYAGGGGGKGRPRQSPKSSPRLSPMHQHLQNQARQSKPPRVGGYAGIAQARGAHPHGGGFSIVHLAKGVGHVAEGAAKDVYEVSPFSRDSYKAARGNRAASNREIGTIRRIAENTTGYQEIKHIREHPLSGGLAIAGLLPIGRFGKVAEAIRAGDEEARAVKQGSGVISDFRASRAAKKAARRGPFRTTAQAHQHVLEKAVRARQQGFGRILPKIPSVARGAASPETGGAAGALVRQGLKGVGHERNVQEAERAIERSKRAGAVEEASRGSGAERHFAAKSELKGQLPASQFKGFEPVAPHVDELINHIYDHPHFQPFEKVKAADAILEGVKGKVPTKSDQKLLERAFGKEHVPGIMGSLKSGKLEHAFANIMGVPRSIMASGDLSAPFRQGLGAMAAKPDIFFKGMPRMLGHAVSEDRFQAAMKEIHSMPEFPLMEKAKLALTDIGETAKGAEDLNKREEQFVSNLAEQIPVAGHIVRGSDRAYVGFLNMTRARLFNVYVHQAAENGWHLNDKLLEDIGRMVNALTGRGDLGSLSRHTATMNTLFFSPRLLYSRLNLLGFGGAGKWSFIPGSYYASLEPFARREALKASMRLLGTLSTTLFFAKMAGAKVNMDPTNADFGKIRIGNTRLDIAAGIQQPIRLLAQLETGRITSSTTGKKEYLTGGFAHQSRYDVATRFLQGKLAPVPATLVDYAQGQGFGGQPVSAGNEASSHLIPLLWQDLYGLAHSKGPGSGKEAAELAFLPDLLGVGIQNYAPTKKKKSGSQSYNSGGYGGSDPYSGSGGYSSGGGYGP